jgi:hypothetical protein
MRILLKFIIGTSIFIVAFAIFLEIGSRHYRCQITDQNPQAVLVCDPDHFPISQSKSQAIQNIIESKQQGIEPSRKDLDRAVNIEKYENMPGFNGVACGDGMIFIRHDLGDEAKYFVARHELEHIFIRHGMNSECDSEEYCATIIAAKVYPAGFVSTIISSLSLSAKESPTVWCFLFGSWKIFKHLMP